MSARKEFRLLCVVAASLLLLAACTPGAETDDTQNSDEVSEADGDMMGDDEMMGDEHEEGDEHEDEEEHMDDMEHAHVDPPEEYEGLTNPLEGDPDAIAAGEEIYTTNCATCHGENGKGDGPAAAGLDPQPADFTDQAMMMDMSDGYLFWRVTEGGAFEPFNSAMPPWGQSLTEDERWQVISYIRTLDN